MIKIERLTYRELMENYGDPGTKKGLQEIRSNLIRIMVPFTLQPHNVTAIMCHQYIADAYRESLEEILDYYGLEYIEKFGINKFAGCFVTRKTSSGDWWSIHSWAMAIDHNPHLGAFGSPSIMPYQFVNAFKKHGFGWGGDWKGRKDGMHFSATGT